MVYLVALRDADLRLERRALRRRVTVLRAVRVVLLVAVLRTVLVLLLPDLLADLLADLLVLFLAAIILSSPYSRTAR